MGTINRAQQAYYLENEHFATTLEELQLGIRAETDNYRYVITNSDSSQAIVTATAKEDKLKSYTSAVFIIKDSDGIGLKTAGVCETNTSSKTPPTTPEVLGNEIQCPSGSSKI